MKEKENKMATKKEKIRKIQEKIDTLLEGDINDLKVLDNVDKLERQINDINESEEVDEQDNIVEPQAPKAPIDHEAVYTNLIAIPSSRKIYRSQDAYNVAHSSQVHDNGEEKQTHSSLRPKKR